MGGLIGRFIGGAAQGATDVADSYIKTREAGTLAKVQADIEEQKQKRIAENAERLRREGQQADLEFKTDTANVGKVVAAENAITSGTSKAKANAAGLLARTQDENRTREYAEGTTVERPDGTRFKIGKTAAPESPNERAKRAFREKLSTTTDPEQRAALTQQGIDLGYLEVSKNRYEITTDPDTGAETVKEIRYGEQPEQKTPKMTREEASARAVAEASSKAGVFRSDKTDFGSNGREAWITNRTEEILRASGAPESKRAPDNEPPLPGAQWSPKVGAWVIKKGDKWFKVN